MQGRTGKCVVALIQKNNDNAILVMQYFGCPFHTIYKRGEKSSRWLLCLGRGISGAKCRDISVTNEYYIFSKKSHFTDHRMFDPEGHISSCKLNAFILLELASALEIWMICSFPYATLLWRAASFHSWFWVYLKMCHVPGRNLSLTVITMHCKQALQKS